MGNGPYFTNRESTKDSQITKLRTLQGTAAPQPNQGTRTADAGAGGTVTLTGRGTMEQK